MAIQPDGPEEFSVPDELRFELRQNSDDVCAFCGLTNEALVDETGSGLHAHHVIPKAVGGDHQLENLILVCPDCHKTLQYTQSRAMAHLKEWMDYLVQEHLGEDIDAMAEDRVNFTFPGGEENGFWHSFAQPCECPSCGTGDLYRTNTVTARCPDCGTEFEPFEAEVSVVDS